MKKALLSIFLLLCLPLRAAEADAKPEKFKEFRIALRFNDVRVLIASLPDAVLLLDGETKEMLPAHQCKYFSSDLYSISAPDLTANE